MWLLDVWILLTALIHWLWSSMARFVVVWNISNTPLNQSRHFYFFEQDVSLSLHLTRHRELGTVAKSRNQETFQKQLVVCETRASPWTKTHGCDETTSLKRFRFLMRHLTNDTICWVCRFHHPHSQRFKNICATSPPDCGTFCNAPHVQSFWCCPQVFSLSIHLL